jgi:NTE family protein
MCRRWEQGLSDTQATLLASPWLAPMAPEVGARTFDVLRDLHREDGAGSAEPRHRDA